MISEDHKVNVISASLEFIRAITEAYGNERGMELFNTVADTIDPDIKGEIFFAMITGEYTNSIRITGLDITLNRISQIKTLRTITGYGLKEAKDACDELAQNRRHLTIKCQPNKRNLHILELRGVGFHV